MGASLENECYREQGILVTGGSGFIGSNVLSQLLAVGVKPSALCRSAASASRVPESVELRYGDVKCQNDLNAALIGIKAVIHCAAAMSGAWGDFFETTVMGTQNLLNSILENGTGRLIYVSSLGVLDYSAFGDGDLVDESSRLEAQPVMRGHYTRAKVEAERMVEQFAAEHSEVEVVIIRPGLVYGDGVNACLRNSGVVLGRAVLVFGMGGRYLGLNSVENLSKLISGLVLKDDVRGVGIVNAVDSEQPIVRTYIKAYNEFSMRKVFPIYIPIFIWRCIFKIADTVLMLVNKKLYLSHKFNSNSKVLCYSNVKSKVVCANFVEVEYRDVLKDSVN